MGEQGLIKRLATSLVPLLVLHVLDKFGELHGYLIAKKLRKMVKFHLSLSTLYPVLKRLEGDGYIVGRWVLSEGRSAKKYRITSKGKETLRVAKEFFAERLAEVLF
mgnify:CR=1 FL=1